MPEPRSYDTLTPELATRWLAAIPERRSRRRFDGRSLTPEQVAALTQACREFRPWPAARVELINEAPTDVMTGLIGGYGRFPGAAAYLAFIGGSDAAVTSAQIGYTGEAMVLEATALGVGSCWVGGLFRRSAVAARLALGGDERLAAVAPLGHALTDPTALDLLIRGAVQPQRRKPLTAIYSGELMTTWLLPALEAARLAPSAVNRQPWLFRLAGQSVTCEVQGGVPQFAHLDCGIAMLHFELGARQAGVIGHWEWLTGKEVGRFVVA